MHSFTRRGKELFCEDVALSELAHRYGTPLYVYSHAALTRHYQAYEEAFAGISHIICYAVKANPSGAILNTLGEMGSGADIVSGGELYRAMRAGIPASRIVYSGVGKTKRETEEALDADILMFNIESFTELSVLNETAGRMGKKARISLRINPDIDPVTHPYISTGLRKSKFGIPFEAALEGYKRAGRLTNIEIAGVDCHIGSQLMLLEPFKQAIRRLLSLAGELRSQGYGIALLDIGGGLGIPYADEKPPSPGEYAKAVADVLGNEKLKLLIEPGRSIVGNAGILLTQVLYTKKGEGKRFVIVDAGMNDFIRPCLYDAYHEIVHVYEVDRSMELCDIVGPVCESGDFFALNRTLPGCVRGDLLAVMSAGAYGSSMSSVYNSRPLAAEALVKGSASAIIRERGTYSDLTSMEAIPEL